MASRNTVKVAVRVRPLNDGQTPCISTIPESNQVCAGVGENPTAFTYDHTFDSNSTQASVYDECVLDLVNSAFDGFNATILAYGQTGSGKTWTMGSGSSADLHMDGELVGIIPRVIQSLFIIVKDREALEPMSTYKIHVQFLELYGEDIKDLLDATKTSKVVIRELTTGEVVVSGAREELVTSYEEMMKTLEVGSKQRTTAKTKMNDLSSRSHAIFTVRI